VLYAVIGVLLSASLTTAQTSTATDSVYLAGEAAYRDGRYAESVAHLRNAVRASSDSAEAWSLLGRALYRNGEYLEAERAMREAIHRAPIRSEYYTYLGLILTEQQRLNDATAAYFTALGIAPSNTEARYNLGLIYHQRKQHPLALIQFRRLKAEHPSFLDARFAIAKVLSDQGQFDAAYAELNDALAVDSTNAATWVEHGSLAMHRHRYADAVSLFRRALELDTTNTRARYGLGLAHTFRREWVAAQAQCDTLATYDRQLATQLQRVITP